MYNIIYMSDFAANVPSWFYSFGPGAGDIEGPTSDDGYTSAIPITGLGSFPFYGTSYDQIIVSINLNIFP